jgi:hypothetical protein
VHLQSYAGPFRYEDNDEEEDNGNNGMRSTIALLTPLEQKCIYTAPVISFLSAEERQDVEDDEDEDGVDEHPAAVVDTFQVVVLIDLVCHQ